MLVRRPTAAEGCLAEADRPHLGEEGERPEDWFPSLALDASGTPHAACVYINRVQTYSATYSKLLLLTRLERGNWRCEVIAGRDDGYYGGDGRSYTGALAPLVFDEGNRPRVVFSDIASTHWAFQRLNVGNIRYGIRESGGWRTRTLYRQPLPTGFTQATEMHGLILALARAGEPGSSRRTGARDPVRERLLVPAAGAGLGSVETLQVSDGRPVDSLQDPERRGSAERRRWAPRPPRGRESDERGVGVSAQRESRTPVWAFDTG